MIDEDPAAIEQLLEIMARLRSPEGGCPWDLEQDFRSIAPYTVEEAYEVTDAIERGDMTALREELGDLLFQVVFHARMAEEQDAFAFEDVARTVVQKMIERHPHVFGGAAFRSADEQTAAWERQKAAERVARGKSGLLADVPVSLPGMTRAVKLQKRAAAVGFDWTDVADVLKKLDEEVGELAAAAASKDKDAIEDEFGDLLFVIANVARHLNVDPEGAIRRANEKFARRFAHIEGRLAEQGRAPVDATLDEMEALWIEAKRLEKSR